MAQETSVGVDLGLERSLVLLVLSELLLLLFYCLSVVQEPIDHIRPLVAQSLLPVLRGSSAHLRAVCCLTSKPHLQIDLLPCTQTPRLQLGRVATLERLGKSALVRRVRAEPRLGAYPGSLKAGRRQ